MLSFKAYFPTYYAHSGAGAAGAIGDIDVPSVHRIPRSSVSQALHDPDDIFTRQFVVNSRALVAANSILVNAFDAMEPEAIAALCGSAVVTGLPPVFAVGPLMSVKLRRRWSPSARLLHRSPSAQPGDAAILHFLFPGFIFLDSEQSRATELAGQISPPSLHHFQITATHGISTFPASSCVPSSPAPWALRPGIPHLAAIIAAARPSSAPPHSQQSSTSASSRSRPRPPLDLDSTAGSATAWLGSHRRQPQVTCGRLQAGPPASLVCTQIVSYWSLVPWSLPQFLPANWRGLKNGTERRMDPPGDSIVCALNSIRVSL
ncbi:unnamed protein product [Urochloa humidicola]